MVLGTIKTRRSQPVLDLLEKLKARLLGGFGFGPTKQRISIYSVRGRLVLLHDRGADGWDVYTPLVESNRVDETLQALEAYAKGDR